MRRRSVISGRLAKNIVINGNFSNGTTGWASGFSALSVVDSKLHVARISSSIYVTQSVILISGHKYFVKLIDAETNMSSVYFYFSASANFARLDTAGYSVIATATTDYTYFALGRGTYVDGTYLDIGKVIMIDLTADFGIGNEPSVAQVNAALSIYPNSWFKDTAYLDI